MDSFPDMRSGYLYLQTHQDHPELVRVLASEYVPSTIANAPLTAVRYIAHFNDMEVAKMHFHSEQRRYLVDIDSALYQIDILEGMATLEALDLRHQRVWIDPKLSALDLQRLDERVARHRRRHRRVDAIWRTVGYIAIALLAVSALSSLL